MLSTSLLTAIKTQGKTQWKKHWQRQGTTFCDISLLTDFRFAKGESTIRRSLYSLSSALTAPMLLPQTATLKFFSFRNLTALSTSKAYFLPSDM